jgi:outer membrane protein OmpA-like peptidoglycan-associated protein
MKRLLISSPTVLLGLTLASTAQAAPEGEGGPSAGGSASLGGSTKSGVEGDAETDADADGASDGESKAREPKNKRKDQKWIHRWAPEPMTGEIGIYGGLFLPNERLELFDPDLSLPDQGWKTFDSPAPDFGLRAGFYPSSYFGIEAEGGVIPMRADGGSGTGYTIRGSVVGQLGKWSITPFILAGFGGLGINSDRSVVGKDIDPALHFGGGLKFYFTRYFMMRLDLRDVISNQQGVDNTFKQNNFEALLGFSLVLGRKNNPPPREQDPERLDTDGDGFYDDEDSCVKEPGIAPDGCPEGDRDGDGFLDSQDSCPDEAGVDPDGCPIRDTDGDGILDPDDKCVDEPETKNNYQDADGCPDEIPEEVKKFAGVIEGVYFDTNKTSIKPVSEKILKKALKVLKDFPDVKLEISGHTDSRGKASHNKQLSEGRAAAVKQWLVDNGIAAERLTTSGFGPENPIDTNDTKAGRAKNRRIEFKLVE